MYRNRKSLLNSFNKHLLSTLQCVSQALDGSQRLRGLEVGDESNWVPMLRYFISQIEGELYMKSMKCN